MLEPGAKVTRTIESEQITRRNVPDFIVKMTPSACFFTLVTGFKGFHWAKVLVEDKNSRSSGAPTRMARRRLGITAARFEAAWSSFAIGALARPLASKSLPTRSSQALPLLQTDGPCDPLCQPPFRFSPQLASTCFS